MIDFGVTKPNNIDTIFSWESEKDYEPNECRVRVYWITWEKAIVIATDLTHNPGRKVANVTKDIIRFITHIYDLVSCKIMLIEHYSAGDSFKDDTFLQVLLANDEVMRYEINKSKLIELTETSI